MKKLILFIVTILISFIGIGQTEGIVVFDSLTPPEDIKRFQDLFIDTSKLFTNPVIYPSFNFGAPSTGIAIKPKEENKDKFIISPFDYENTEITFIIEGEEVLRFFKDSIILYFKGKEIVIKEDSLCNLLNEITKETFNKY